MEINKFYTALLDSVTCYKGKCGATVPAFISALSITEKMIKITLIV